MDNQPNAPRLTRAVKHAIKRMLIEGRNSAQVNAMLAGRAIAPLAPSTITGYRQSRAVQGGIVKAEQEELSTGIAVRSERIKLIKWGIETTVVRMRGLVPQETIGEGGAEPTPNPEGITVKEYCALAREMQTMLKLLGDMVDRNPLAILMAEQEAERIAGIDQGSDQATRNTILQGNFTAMVADMMEEIEKEDDAKAALLMIEEEK